MSTKRHKGKKKQGLKPRRSLSPRQTARLQQAQRAQASGNPAFAEAEYRALLADKAATPEVYCRLAEICLRSNRAVEARTLWKKALAVDPRSREAGMNLADSYQQSGDLESAAGMYRKIIAGNKRFVTARYHLANILKAQGKLDQARTCYLQIIELQPDYTQAHFTYAGIHKYRDRADPHITAMLGLYERRDLGTDNRIHLAFALGKAFEDIGEYATAFDYLRTGNALRLKGFQYDIDSDRALIQSIMHTFSAAAMAGLDMVAESSDRPIFIVGMPRSGTSLVEKILASHSAVHGAGELDYMFALGTGLFLKQSPDYLFKALDSYPRNAFETVGRTYLERIALLDATARHVTDKMPFNLMMIGLIRIALPNAKIIHCVRDARDTCLSIYKQNFTTGNYRFAYDLKTIGQFHKLYQRLMQHWHETMPGVIHDVSYEALTRDPEDQIRKLLEVCGLEFQQDCVNFDRTESVVKTASAFQVRQPMYTSSISLWEKYAEFLEPLLSELGGD